MLSNVLSSATPDDANKKQFSKQINYKAHLFLTFTSSWNIQKQNNKHKTLSGTEKSEVLKISREYLK